MASTPGASTGRARVPPHPPAVDWRTADATAPDELRAALEGADVAYMAAQPPYHRWPQEFPAMMDRVVGAAQAAGVRRLVMVDNLYAYGPGSSPMSERSPQAATDRKGRTRAAMADALMAVHQSGPDRGGHRPGLGLLRSGRRQLRHHGAGHRTGRRAWEAALDGVDGRCRTRAPTFPTWRAPSWPWAGLADSAGRIWHLPHAPAVTGAQFLALVNDALPEPRGTALVSPGMLRLAAPFHRISRESLPLAYQWTEPFLVDDSDFRARFPEFVSTPMAEAVAATVAHCRQAEGAAARAA